VSKTLEQKIQELAADLLYAAGLGPPRRKRKTCARGHPDDVYGTTNAEGYRRCRKCLAENQAKHVKRRKKKPVASAPILRRRRKARAKPARARGAVPPKAPVQPEKSTEAPPAAPKKTVDLIASAAAFFEPVLRAPAVEAPARPPARPPARKGRASRPGGSSSSSTRRRRDPRAA
jgi:hypothetical protein